MPIFITPDTDIPLPFDLTPEEVVGFRERAKAACASIQELISVGATIKVSDEDSTNAHTIVSSENLNVRTTPPGTILKIDSVGQRPRVL